MTRLDPDAEATGAHSSLPSRRTVALGALLAVIVLSGVLGPAGAGDGVAPFVGTGAGADVAGTASPAAIATQHQPTGAGQASVGPSDEVTHGSRADAAQAAAACEGPVPAAAPDREAIYVEVDSAANVSLHPGTLDRLEEAFAAAPVEGGLDIHFVRSDDDLPTAGPVNNDERPGQYSDIADYRDRHFDRADLGYHYLLVVPEAAYEGNASYAGAGKQGAAVVESYRSETIMASLIMHELGHAFGLSETQAGIDERTHDVSAYESVMNYNGLYEVMTYSDGSGDVGRNEWEFVANDRHTPERSCPGGDCTAVCPSAG